MCVVTGNFKGETFHVRDSTPASILGSSYDARMISDGAWFFVISLLQGCQTITMRNISTAYLTHPLYQLRVEDVDKVEIEGLEVGPAGLDLSVRGSREVGVGRVLI